MISSELKHQEEDKEKLNAQEPPDNLEEELKSCTDLEAFVGKSLDEFRADGQEQPEDLQKELKSCTDLEALVGKSVDESKADGQDEGSQLGSSDPVGCLIIQVEGDEEELLGEGGGKPHPAPKKVNRKPVAKSELILCPCCKEEKPRAEMAAKSVLCKNPCKQAADNAWYEAKGDPANKQKFEQLRASKDQEPFYHLLRKYIRECPSDGLSFWACSLRCLVHYMTLTHHSDPNVNFCNYASRGLGQTSGCTTLPTVSTLRSRTRQKTCSISVEQILGGTQEHERLHASGGIGLLHQGISTRALSLAFHRLLVQKKDGSASSEDGRF